MGDRNGDGPRGVSASGDNEGERNDESVRQDSSGASPSLRLAPERRAQRGRVRVSKGLAVAVLKRPPPVLPVHETGTLSMTGAVIGAERTVSRLGTSTSPWFCPAG